MRRLMFILELPRLYLVAEGWLGGKHLGSCSFCLLDQSVIWTKLVTKKWMSSKIFSFLLFLLKEFGSFNGTELC
jgi:hypothetical protein